MTDSSKQSNRPAEDGKAPGHRIRRHFRRRWWVWYLALVLTSHAVELFPQTPDPPGSVAMEAVEIPETTSTGAIPDRSITLAYRRWAASGGSNSQEGEAALPIIFLHGSPGDSGSFTELAPRLASTGRECLAPDLPGFGRSDHWIGDYSIRAHARAVLAMMDALKIERAHIVAWSMGGGVAVNMSDIAPDRLASITLMASIAAQETEGSGEYFFEHAKYALGYLGFVVGGELVPLPWHRDRWSRHSWIRNFFDTDQRPLRGMLEHIEIPTLVLHGRHDPLVPYWGARRHAEIITNSRLVMLDASHFIPFSHPDEAASWIGWFIDDAEAGENVAGEFNFAYHPARSWLTARAFELGAWIRSWHWLMQALLFLAIGRSWIVPGIALAGLLRATEDVNLAVSLVGLLGAGMLSPGGPSFRRPHRLVLSGLAIWALSFFAWIVSRSLVLGGIDRLGFVALPIGFVVLMLGVAILRGVWTRASRQRILASISRVLNHEFWPMWAFYLPLVPWLVLLSIRYRGPLVFTRINPGISHGGGIAGESKIEILHALKDTELLLEAHVIDAGLSPGSRVERAIEIMDENEKLSRFPVVLKPLAGERGQGVRIVQSRAEIAEYLGAMADDAIIQQYHPGPAEVGILWARDPHHGDVTSAGRIVSITIKRFPSVVGDGRRSIRELILAHGRYRCQAAMFFRTLGERANKVPDAGERVSISSIGNHARGAIFRDGSRLITPELSERIDKLARSFRGVGDAGLDYGRFDVRSGSLERIARAKDLAIVELNGTTAESTNLYDPSRMVIGAYRVLFAQWTLVYKLGAARRKNGDKGIRFGQLIAMLAQHHMPPSGSQAASRRR